MERKSSVSGKTPHRYSHEQHVEVLSEKDYPAVVQVLALLPGRCKEHSAPMYGCSGGGAHFSFCEELLKPLSPTAKRKMN